MFKRNSYNITANTPGYYIKDGAATDNGKQEYCGKIHITITAIDNLYIGSGFKGSNKTTTYNDTMQLNGKAVIPGSSLKGAVRHVANIASDGCLINPEREYKREKRHYYFDRKLINCSGEQRCIICDMFGMMGRKSKVSFSDCVSDNAENDVIQVNAQNSPKINDPTYHDNGAVYGYKVYMNKCEPYHQRQKDSIRIVKKGAVFCGNVFFENLTRKELGLLCFALGLSETINLKLGGYRNEGLGQVQIRGTITSNPSAETPKQLAEEYIQSCEDSDVIYSIEDLEEYLAPYKGGGRR